MSKNSFTITLLLLVLFLSNTTFSQDHNNAYANVKKELTAGWNTWSTYSMAQHILLPHGFSINLALKKSSKNSDGSINRFFVNKQANGWKQPSLKPGYHSYNGDYTQLEITYRKVTFMLETAAFGDDFVMLLTPSKIDEQYDLTAIFEAGIVWNKSGEISRDKDALIFKNAEKTIAISASSKVLNDPFIDSYSPYLAMVINQPIGLSSLDLNIEGIQNKIAEKRKEYAEYIDQFGSLSESYAGMSSCLAWNTIYDPKNERIFTTVDRSWNKSRGGYVFFGWDNFFMAHMIGLDNPNLAMANAIEALNEVTEDGFVSNQSQANGRKSWDRSQPPVGSMMSWEIYQKHKEVWFLEEIYPKLARWNDWWLEKRMAGKLLAWGSHISKNPFYDTRYNTLKAAMLETGIDDSPMYVDASFDADKGIMQMHDVGLNAMYIGDTEALLKMAKVLNKKTDIKKYQKRLKDFKKNIQSLWNEENKLFQNYDLVTNDFNARISPTSFYPLIARSASEKQASNMVNVHMLNENEFWGQWALPSISKNDPLYEKQKYWKGAIWAPMNFLVYYGMKDYESLENARKNLVSKSLDLFDRNWNNYGFVCENYSPIDGSCTQEKLQSSSWYTWGGMMAIIALMEEGYY